MLTAIAPSLTEVTICLNDLSLTSPAANTPLADVSK